MPKLSSRLAQHLLVGTFFASTFLWLVYLTGEPAYIYDYGIDIIYKDLNAISIAVITVIIASLLVSLGLLISQISSVIFYAWNASAFNKEIKSSKWLTEFLKDNTLEYENKISEVNILLKYWDSVLSSINILREYKIKYFCREFKKWRKERKLYRCDLKNMDTRLMKDYRLRLFHESIIYFLMSYIHAGKDMDTSFIHNEFWLLDVKSSINASLIILLTVFAAMPFILALFDGTALSGVHVLLVLLLVLFFLPVICKYQAMVYQRFCRILLSTVYVVAHRNELRLVENQKA